MNDKNFIDWESHVFGFGYGTGEQHTLRVLKDFLKFCDERAYDYKKLEKQLTPTVTWLMINILCHADIIEYGTSPRYGWLTPKGELLKRYINEKTVDQLYELTSVDQDYIHCYPDYCNCDLPKGTTCNNPLFKANHA